MTDQEKLKLMHQVAIEIGPVEWGATGELPVEKHLEHVKASIENTAKHFGQDGPQSMHGVYIGGSDIVLCHTGTSPNSPAHANILTALWNCFVAEAIAAQEPPHER
ncbi:hypothetical protein [Sulfitobacter sp. PM12]|uniref:hypothetical protein n=1 Tax=Sulfitobacter sp. PM12 TaxID=3138497 RepID=UPI00388E3AAB